MEYIDYVVKIIEPENVDTSKFKLPLNDPVSFYAATICQDTGYETSEHWQNQHEFFVYKVPKEEEDNALEILTNHKYVEWAEKRDHRAEKVWESIDKVVSDLEELRGISDAIEFDKKKYNAKVDEIVSYVKTLKEE
jgi:hypothetical protein